MTICEIFTNIVTSSTFWTAASAIATAIMAWLTYETIQNSKEQVETMKRQWEKENRAYLEILPVFMPFTRKEGDLAIEIRNIGNKTAFDISISIEKNFRNGFPIDSIKQKIDKICNEKYRILPNGTKTLVISSVRMMGNKNTLFGENISEEKLQELNNYLKDFSFRVHCKYNRDEFDQVLTSEDQELQKYDNLNFLEEIEWDLSSIKESMQMIYSSLDEIAMKN